MTTRLQSLVSVGEMLVRNVLVLLKSRVSLVPPTHCSAHEHHRMKRAFTSRLPPRKQQVAEML